MTTLNPTQNALVVPLKTTYAKALCLLVVVVVAFQVTMAARADISISATLPHTFLVSFIELQAMLIGFTLAMGAIPVWLLLASRSRAITVSRNGIGLHTPSCDIDLLWEEIAIIKTFGSTNRSVGIVPNDVAAVGSRLKRGQRFVYALNAGHMNRSNRRGQFSAPIVISQVILPISADELLESIRAFQLDGHVTGPLVGDDPDADPASWPPRPAARRW